MKTDELTGAALDWAVCVAVYGYGADYKKNRYSTDWAQGGPIMERENIATAWHITRWVAWRGVVEHPGPTPLIAAMRCFVASKMGNDIEIPEELTKGKSK
jgi:hypothetical protein